MSVDMSSQASDSNEEDFEEEENEGAEEEDQGDMTYYYEGVAGDVEQAEPDTFDPEEYQFTCLTYRESQRLLTEEVSPAVAKLVLVHFHWQVSHILDRYKSNSSQLLCEAQVQPITTCRSFTAVASLQCGVCLQFVRRDALLSLPCQHSFCKSCWEQHCTVLVKDGIGVGISCMAQDCSLQTPEDFVLPLLPSEELKDKYRRYLFRDYVESHFQLQLCPGADCPIVIKVQEPRARRVQCSRCDEVFCFKCRQMYHAPTDCATIRKWLTKCADDSETANYISAHTKDCPKCNICIEKNGGCNHMCRYTLQYTYPYAYYMESGPRKKLASDLTNYYFEYQQAQLEAEIENLSWKVERADSYERVEGELNATDRGDLENQMHIAEQKRRTLLKDFHDT
ncbi:E3 ubiquitin-protein ligase ARIH2 [Bagarius yarrelli]|uniref:RBR-type E3 ubiquitin transferase n=1 Tax=Bagarius yarrelli TaxID=175774 RepID=A0A556UFG1_BAGYA|nr:E3 ubiquitin-protein ligase ARIH2 [Bagarius yarrelli]